MKRVAGGIYIIHIYSLYTLDINIFYLWQIGIYSSQPTDPEPHPHKIYFVLINNIFTFGTTIECVYSRRERRALEGIVS